MGVTFDLRMIDHRHVVERGFRAVNNAIAKGDTSILIEYILTIPFTPDPEVIAYRQARCHKLRELKAPGVIIQNEERMLRLVNGDAYSCDELSTKTISELCHLLGTWGWAHNSFGVDKAWYELDWFLQPADGPDDYLMYPIRPKVGDPAQTTIDQALKGSQKSPVDSTGSPIIRPCGSDEDDCFGYNPPKSIPLINEALAAIDAQTWDELVPRRIDQYRRASQSLGDNADGIVAQELEHARTAFTVMQKAYTTAQEKGFGVACEYSL